MFENVLTNSDIVFCDENTDDTRKELWGRTSSGHESCACNIGADFELKRKTFGTLQLQRFSLKDPKIKNYNRRKASIGFRRLMELGKLISRSVLQVWCYFLLSSSFFLLYISSSSFYFLLSSSFFNCLNNLSRWSLDVETMGHVMMMMIFICITNR